MIDIAFKTINNKVLLIEDNAADTVLIKAKLEQLFDNLEVETAPSLREAYKISGNNNFNFILLDLNLPDGFGPNSVADIMKFQKKHSYCCFHRLCQ